MKLNRLPIPKKTLSKEGEKGIKIPFSKKLA
jgi:hypothetical protein